MEKISAVYKIVNTVTGDFYVGSSRNVKRRWAEHKCPYRWSRESSSPLYQDMQKYGVENFRFQILAPIVPERLKEVEQRLIEMLHPTYNNYRAKGWDVERHKEHRKEYQKEHNQSERQKERVRKCSKNYYNRRCSYKGETLTLATLANRFCRAGIEHPTLEAKKYLIKGE